MRQNVSLSHDAVISFYRRIPLLHGIRDDDLELLAQKTRPYCYDQGETIFRMGDPPNRIYFVYEGVVAELVSYGISEEIIIRHRKPYDYIGEMGVLLERSYPNTAMAGSALTLLGIPRQTFCPIARNNPDILLHVIGQLSDRLQSSSQKRASDLSLDARGRLASTLLQLTAHAEGREISIAITQAQLATAAGTVRQTVARILGEWRRAGYLSTQRGRIVVEDLNALLDIVSEEASR